MPLNGFGYESLKAHATELGRPLHSLLCLSDDNDPFLCDRPGRRRAGAEWFADLWTRLEIPDGVHLRRLHYLLVSTANIILPGGEPYQNTHRCWKMLGSAAADARFLNFVDAGAFIDRRAPEPITYLTDDEAAAPCITVDSASRNSRRTASRSWSTRRLNTVSPIAERRGSPAELDGAYAIELWVEKSTVDDILEPIARVRGVGFVTGVGELSITACHALVRRVREHRRATRILYHLRLRSRRQRHAGERRPEDRILSPAQAATTSTFSLFPCS